MKYTVLVDGKREPNPKLGSMPLYSLDLIAWMELLTEMGFRKIDGDQTWEHLKDPELLLSWKVDGSLISLEIYHSKSGGISKSFTLVRTHSASLGIDELLTEIRNIYRS